MALSQRRTRLVARLRSRKGREREGLVLVEGVRAVAQAFATGADVRFAVVSPRLEQLDPEGSVRAALHAYDVSTVDDDELSDLSDTETPQGVLVVCAEPTVELPRMSGERFLVLDAVQDPGNVGTLVRSAVAFGLDGVLCLDGTVDPWGAKAVRASAGLLFAIPVAHGKADEVLDHLVSLAVPVLVADAAGADPPEYRGGRFALVVGNEGSGARDSVRARADAAVAVHMTGPAESLNVGVAGSILLHTLVH